MRTRDDTIRIFKQSYNVVFIILIPIIHGFGADVIDTLHIKIRFIFSHMETSFLRNSENLGFIGCLYDKTFIKLFQFLINDIVKQYRMT